MVSSNPLTRETVPFENLVARNCNIAVRPFSNIGKRIFYLLLIETNQVRAAAEKM